MTEPSRPLDFRLRDELLRDPENAALYLAEYLEEGNTALFQEALRNVAKAQEGGVKGVAKLAGVSRENLYKALSEDGKPRMDTVTKMLGALGLRFTITAAH